jgi:hypothetical protein
VISEQTELRAERLRVAMVVLDAVGDYNAGKYPEAAPLLASSHDTALARTVSGSDRELALACLDVERDACRREWGGLEDLLGAIPPGGDLDSVFELPTEVAFAALTAARRCGWFWDAPEEPS